MQFGKASTYGVLATLRIAQRGGDGPVQAWIIAEECGVSVEHLHLLLLQLVRRRTLVSQRGRGGGFSLAKAPSKITLLEIIEAIDGPLDGNLMPKLKKTGPAGARKKLEAVHKAIFDNARKRLSKITIKQLMD